MVQKDKIVYIHVRDTENFRAARAQIASGKYKNRYSKTVLTQCFIAIIFSLKSPRSGDFFLGLFSPRSGENFLGVFF